MIFGGVYLVICSPVFRVNTHPAFCLKTPAHIDNCATLKYTARYVCFLVVRPGVVDATPLGRTDKRSRNWGRNPTRYTADIGASRRPQKLNWTRGDISTRTATAKPWTRDLRPYLRSLGFARLMRILEGQINTPWGQFQREPQRQHRLLGICVLTSDPWCLHVLYGFSRDRYYTWISWGETSTHNERTRPSMYLGPNPISQTKNDN